MCDTYIPANAYKEAHIDCCSCTNTASTFVVSSWVASNYEQAIALSKMKYTHREAEKQVDNKGGIQYTYNTVGESTPWFAQNTSLVPLLVPVCDNCKSKLEVAMIIVNEVVKLFHSLENKESTEEEMQYINCHYGFQLYKLQKSRFNSGSPYFPWIKAETVPYRQSIHL